MTFIEKARRIANDTKFKEKIGDALEDAGNALAVSSRLCK